MTDVGTRRTVARRRQSREPAARHQHARQAGERPAGADQQVERRRRLLGRLSQLAIDPPLHREELFVERQVARYVEHVRRSKRADAKAVLLENAQILERQMSIVNKYNSDAANAPITVSPAGSSGTTVNYNITVACGAGANATSFTLRATRANAMAGDSCGDFTLTNTGLRDLLSNSSTVAECWNR